MADFTDFKLTTEFLKQTGNQIPGSYGVMCDALGLTWLAFSDKFKQTQYSQVKNALLEHLKTINMDRDVLDKIVASVSAK